MQVQDDIQEADYITPDQPGGIPGWQEGIPVFRIYTCGLFTIEMLVEVPEGNPALARYVELPAERLSGRGPGSAQKAVKILLSQEGRYATKDWLRTHLREGQEVCATNKRLENILSYLRCHLLTLPSGKKLADLLVYIRGTNDSGDGYQLAGYPLVWIDIEALAWHVKQACLKERFNDDPLPYWERAYQLGSRGTFLLEEPHSEWATKRREAVDDQMRQCVHALARLYLARYGQAGEEDVLRLLLPYCRTHCQDEDALRPLLELLNKQGRYQEVVEWYERLKDALVEAGADKTGAVRTPQPLTTEIADFAQLKLREATSTRIVEDKQPFSLTPVPDQESHLSGLPFSVLSPAHMVEFSSTQQSGLLRPIFTEQGLLVPSEHGVLVPNALSMHSLPLVEGAHGDCTMWFSERLALIIAFITQWRNQMGFINFQKMLDRELRVFDEIKALFDPDAYFLSRRSALLVIAALPTGLLSFIQLRKTTFVEEEVLPACAASLTACWYLLNGREFASVEQTLSKLMPYLLLWARHPSTYQKSAACLAAQGCLLLSLVASHRLQLHHRVVYCEEAVAHAREAGDCTLLVKALTMLGNARYDLQMYDDMLRAYQEAKHYTDQALHTIPKVLQCKVLMGLAHAYAQHGQVKESLDAITEARAIFPEEVEELPTFLSADDGLFSLILFEGWVRLDLGRLDPKKMYFEDAAQSLASIEELPKTTLIPERIRVEITNRRAQAALALGDLSAFRRYMLQSAEGLKVVQSEKRRQEMVTNYKAARKKWPHEAQVQELADVLL